MIRRILLVVTGTAPVFTRVCVLSFVPTSNLSPNPERVSGVTPAPVYFLPF
jgi:hypothetical protein